FVSSKYHRDLDRERACWEREKAARRWAERQRREIQRFKREFKQAARRQGGDNPKHVHSLYRHFVRAWRDCCACIHGEPARSVIENQRRFRRIHMFMRRRYGRFWFALYDFEFAEGM